MTQLNLISNHHLNITYKFYQHNIMLEVDNIITVVRGNDYTWTIRERYICPRCKAPGNKQRYRGSGCKCTTYRGRSVLVFFLILFLFDYLQYVVTVIHSSLEGIV